MVDIIGKIGKSFDKGGGHFEIDMMEHRGLFRTKGKIRIVFDKQAKTDLIKHLGTTSIEDYLNEKSTVMIIFK
tara:strand:+ start:23689 stop:23907 length:219 start_codon:yes stop_codon:yes gene_type:complete